MHEGRKECHQKENQQKESGSQRSLLIRRPEGSVRFPMVRQARLRAEKIAYSRDRRRVTHTAHAQPASRNVKNRHARMTFPVRSGSVAVKSL